MIESRLVAHCKLCGDAFRPKPFEVPVRPDRDSPISAMTVYPSGCHCGESFTKLLTEKEKKHLNLPSKKWLR
jgi:hypothetical protein